MATLDLIILAVVGLGVWRGVRTGAVRQIVGLVGIVIAIFAGAVFMRPVGAVVVASLGVAERLGPALGFAVTFSAVLAVATIAAHAVRKTLDFLRLGFVDRLAGGGFGGLRAALGFSVLLLVTGVALPGGAVVVGSEERKDSVLYEPVHAIAPAAWGLLRRVAPGAWDRLRETFEAGDARS